LYKLLYGMIVVYYRLKLKLMFAEEAIGLLAVTQCK